MNRRISAHRLLTDRVSKAQIIALLERLAESYAYWQPFQLLIHANSTNPGARTDRLKLADVGEVQP
jgi:hypothetical protein